MTDADRLRLAFTDRHGPDGPRASTDSVAWDESERDESERNGVARYGFNLGLHVGDDPALVLERRRRLGEHVVFMDQVHGARVAVIEDDPGKPLPATDGLVTRAGNLALAVMVADCLPVLLFEPQAEVVGCAHAGRSGIMAGVLGATLEAMVFCGARADRTEVWIGPSIGPCCYEVPAAMRDDVAALMPEAAGTTRWGTPSLDLRAAAVAQLNREGVTRITVSDVCTVESGDHFSYRRDGVTGRFVGLIERLPVGKP